jgi:membrane-associated protease RseP (regulator of RpoE activity)
MLALQRLFVGPLSPTQDVVMNPWVMSGWFGTLVTMLNLLPVGQLDGGHVAFAVLGARARLVGRAFCGALLLLSLFLSWSWVLWFFLVTFLIGTRHPEVERPEEPIGAGRKLIALACAAVLVVSFMPVPIRALAA